MSSLCIALDAMGGDYGPPVVVPAALDALQLFPTLHLILVGDRERIALLLKREKYDAARLSVRHASEQVFMDESPATALRTKKDSSMRVAIQLVKTEEANACVSAGNTGALMAIARFVLKTLPGIDRPAIIYSLPAQADQEEMGCVRMLDLGANVDCQASHLFQFAVMGSVLVAALDKVSRPRIGLLNIGSEAIKGSEVVKQAASLLESSGLHYIGFIEGNTLYQGNVDVVVCDGFVGNVALKVSEGIAGMLVSYLRREFGRNGYGRLVGLLARPILRRVLARVEPSQYNGASLLGLNGIVIKSHGGAKRFGYTQAIKEAVREVEKNIPERIRHEVASWVGNAPL